MSLLKKLGRSLEKAAKKVITNPILNTAVSSALPGAAPFLKVAGAASMASNSFVRSNAMPGSGMVVDSQVGVPLGRGFQGSNVSILPALTGAARAVIPRVGGAVKSYGGAVGGLATAGAILYDAAGNPVARRARRRSKGITARELKSFTRVTSILAKYCKTPPPMKRRGATRSKSCR